MMLFFKYRHVVKMPFKGSREETTMFFLPTESTAGSKEQKTGSFLQNGKEEKQGGRELSNYNNERG